MGLDMFLTQEIYIGAEYKHNKVTGTINISIKGIKQKLKVKNLSLIEYRVAYWRKANAIHNWFVTICQDGIDECQKTYISYDKLLQLKSLCETSLSIINNSKLIDKEIENIYNSNKSIIKVYDCEKQMKELLPPTCGFFFGGYEIDQYYKQDLKDTINQLSDLDENGTYYYRSSW